MRILLINETWGLGGGQEEYILQAGNGLISRGHEIKLIFGKFSGQRKGTERSQFPVEEIFGLDVVSVLKAVKNFRAEVINLQNVFDPYLVEALNLRFPTTRFVHDHSVYCPGNSKYFFNSQKICPIAVSPLCLINAYKEKCMTRRPLLAIRRIIQRQSWLEALKKLPIVLCNSSYIRGQLILNGLEANKVLVNGLFPGHKLLDRDGVSIGLDPLGSNPQRERAKILFVGRLFKEKGADLLLKACARLEVPFNLNIVGEGWEKEKLMSLSKELNLEPKVNFLGFKIGSDLSSLYRECDFLVLPSVWPEGFGMVGLEAGQFHKPVIAFDVGGISDWLTDGVNGLLLPKPDVSLLAEAVSKLINNPELRRRLGNEGFERVESQFSLERHLEVLEASYLKIIK